MGIERRTYLERYRTQRFAAFAAGALFADVPASPGPVACAFRFVDSLTGQATAIAELGNVFVAASNAEGV